ncbi:MAG: ATP synthase F0 subunit B [Candidatus Aminicenantes bacterium]|nr:ATP synthase F0 subunit B [Candidatus Aminicenantes bacterium]
MKKIKIFALLLLAVMLLTASAGEEAHDAASHHVDWFNVLGKVFNSTILFGGLALLLRKPLIKMLSEKSAGIVNDFHEREKKLADTTALLQDIEQRLQKVALEVEQIKSNALANGQEELARLEAAGRDEAARIIALSEEEIQLRVDAAVRSIKSHIADLAIAHFQADFMRSLDVDMQQKIIERNISDCGDIDEAK